MGLRRSTDPGDRNRAVDWLKQPSERPVRSRGLEGLCWSVCAQMVFIAAPSMTTPLIEYFHNATRSLRASATIVVLRILPPLLWTRSWNQTLSAEVGWCRSHSRRSQPPIAGLGDPLFVSDRSALPGCRRQPSVGRQLPSVAEAAEQPFRPEYCRKFRSHPL